MANLDKDDDNIVYASGLPVRVSIFVNPIRWVQVDKGEHEVAKVKNVRLHSTSNEHKQQGPINRIPKWINQYKSWRTDAHKVYTLKQKNEQSQASRQSYPQSSNMRRTRREPYSKGSRRTRCHFDPGWRYQKGPSTR